MIPLILKLRIKDKNQRRFGIWLPAFPSLADSPAIACASGSIGIAGGTHSLARRKGTAYPLFLYGNI